MNSKHISTLLLFLLGTCSSLRAALNPTELLDKLDESLYLQSANA